MVNHNRMLQGVCFFRYLTTLECYHISIIVKITSEECERSCVKGEEEVETVLVRKIERLRKHVGMVVGD